MIIKNGRVIEPTKDIDEILDIYIKDGKIVEMGSDLNYKDDLIIDATGKIVVPGLVDVHVHFRDPGFTDKEDLESGSNSALAGGFTTVVQMANTNPKMDSVEKIREFYNREKKLPLHVYTMSALTKNFDDLSLVNMEDILKVGAVGFSDDGMPNKNLNLIVSAMEKAKNLNALISFHEEDPNLIKTNGINHGDISKKLNIYGSPNEAEYTFIKRDIELARKTGARINIQHISTKEGVDYVKKARDEGLDVHAEVTPHHIVLTEEAVLKYKSLAKMNPPLRREEDRRRIIEGIKEGTIEIIATDHAPHREEEKNVEITKAPSGIIGLETSFGLCNKYLVKKNIISLKDLIRLMSTNPAKIYNLDAGSIEIGKTADIVIIDEDEEYYLNSYYSKSSNTPFKDEKLIGRIYYTIVDGEIKYKLKK